MVGWVSPLSCIADAMPCHGYETLSLHVYKFAYLHFNLCLPPRKGDCNEPHEDLCTVGELQVQDCSCRQMRGQ